MDTLTSQGEDESLHPGAARGWLTGGILEINGKPEKYSDLVRICFLPYNDAAVQTYSNQHEEAMSYGPSSNSAKMVCVTRGERSQIKYLLTKSLEIKPMKKNVENAIKLLAVKITKDIKSEDALRFTQAALNLEHVLAVRHNIESLTVIPE